MVTFVAVHPSLHTPTKVQHGLAPPTTHPGASLKGLGTHGPVVAGGSGALSSMYMYSSEVASVDTTNTTLDRFRAHHSLGRDIRRTVHTSMDMYSSHIF